MAAEDDEGGQGADDDGVHKDLEDAVEALPDGVLLGGGGVRDGRGAETGLIGEDAAADALGDGELHGHAHRAADDGRGVERALEDAGKHAGDRARVGDNDHECADDVDGRHAGDELFGDLTDALDAAEEHERHENGDHNAGDEADDRVKLLGVLMECDRDGVDGGSDGVDLGDVADAERGERAEHGEDDAQPLPLGAETVLDVVHRAAAPVALFVALTVLDREGDLGELGDHAEESGDPHPEHRARAAENDRAGDAGDVARADRGRQCRGDRLHRRDLALARFGLLEDLADGVLPPVADLGELNEADAEAQVNARADQQCQHDGSPYKAVYRTVDFYDLIHVISPLLLNCIAFKRAYWVFPPFLYGIKIADSTRKSNRPTALSPFLLNWYFKIIKFRQYDDLVQ